MVSLVVFHRRAVPSVNNKTSGKALAGINSCLSKLRGFRQVTACHAYAVIGSNLAVCHLGIVHHCLDFVPTAKMRIQLHELGTGRGVFFPLVNADDVFATSRAVGSSESKWKCG